MRLQLTLDSPSVEDCLDLVLATRDSVDIVEVGYPLLMEEGLSLVHHVKHAFPDKDTLANVKIFHSGGYVAKKCFEYGADVVTVLGLASDETFQSVLHIAEVYGRSVVADLAGVENPVARALELNAMGVYKFVIPSGLLIDLSAADATAEVKDEGEAGIETPFQVLESLKEQLPDCEVGVVGHISLQNIDDVVAKHPDVVLVGRAIVHADDPHQVAADLKARMTD